MLDEAAQPLCIEVDERLLEGQEIKGVQSWFSLINYYGRVAAAYRACLDLFAINNKKKLLHLRYRAIEVAIWKEMNWIFIFSDSLSIIRKPIQLYAQSKEQTSIVREYVAGRMYEIAPLGNLMPRQMNDLHAILNRHSQHFAFREGRDNDTPYFVDLARSISPIRWREGLPGGRTFRYFGVGLAYSHLVTLFKEYKKSATLPEWLTPIDEEEDHEAFLSMMRTVCATGPPNHQAASTNAKPSAAPCRLRMAFAMCVP